MTRATRSGASCAGARALFAAACVVAALAAGRAPAAAQRHVDERRQLDRDGYFKIWNLVGSVRVEGWDRDSVRVTGELDARAAGQFFIGAGRGAGKMGIDTSRGEAGRADLVVHLPRGATVWIKSSSASVDVVGMTGSVDVYAVTGDVTVSGAPVSLYAESMGGAVRVTGRPAAARLKSGSGRIEFSGASDDLSFSTVSGDVAVTGAGGPLRRVIVETVSGAVRVACALDRAGSIEVQSHDGPVELRFDAPLDADLTLRTLGGSIRTDAPGARPASARDLRGRQLDATVGRGGAEVSVRTFNGDIVVDTP